MRDSAPNPASKTSAPFAASNSATARTVLANRNRGLLARRKHERQYQHEWDNTKCITNARVVDVEQGSLPGTRLGLSGPGHVSSDDPGSGSYETPGAADG